MNGPIAQLVALTCHGNAFLQGVETAAFFPANWTCIFCDRITFGEAADPDEWFSSLKERGTRGLRLVSRPQNDPRITDRMSAGFVGGGGTWSLEVLLPQERSEFWQASWDVWNQNAPGRRIWRVDHACVAESGTSLLAGPSLADAHERLLGALREIHAFALRHDCGNFTGLFAAGIGALAGSDRRDHHRDLAPPGVLPPAAVALLDACQSAWVFGGMGSWNDMGFSGADGEEYDRVSEGLFQAVTEAIQAAANASLQEP